MSEAAMEHRRRGSDSILGQIKQLWPVLVACCIGYAAWEVQRVKIVDTAEQTIKNTEDIQVLKSAVAVQTAMLTDIRDAVKDISRRRRQD